LHSIPLTVSGFNLFVSRKSIAHVLVSLVFLIDQVISGCDMVMSVCFHTSYGVLLLKIIIFDKLL